MMVLPFEHSGKLFSKCSSCEFRGITSFKLSTMSRALAPADFIGSLAEVEADHAAGGCRGSIDFLEAVRTKIVEFKSGRFVKHGTKVSP